MELQIVLPFCLFLCFSLAFLSAFLVVRVKKGAGPLALLLKTCASIGFFCGALYAAYVNGLTLYNLFIVFGLFFALLGDIVLDLKIAYPEHNKLYISMRMHLIKTVSFLPYHKVTIFFVILHPNDHAANHTPDTCNRP